MSIRMKAKKQWGRGQKSVAADVEERALSLSILPSVPPGSIVTCPTLPLVATDVDEVLEFISGPDHAEDTSETLPTVDKEIDSEKKKERSKHQQVKRKPRKNFTLPQEEEDAVFEWLEKNDLLWRRGHMQFKDTNRKMALWEEKGRELGVPPEHLQGWWRGMHTWYVKLHKVKFGPAAKKLTDREKFVLQKCSFYEGVLRHRSSAPMTHLPHYVNPDAAEAALETGSEVESNLSVDADREEEMETEGLIANIERTAAQTLVYNRGGNIHSTKRRHQGDDEGELFREIRDSMKINSQLLSQLVAEKSSSRSPREPFITYVSDSLRILPDHHYDAVMRKITSLLQNINSNDFSSSADLLSIQPTTASLGHLHSEPPLCKIEPNC